MLTRNFQVPFPGGKLGGGLIPKSGLTLETPWTVACQDPMSIGFSRQEYWSGLPFPSPGDLPDSGIEPGSPALQADSLPTGLPGKPGKLRLAFNQKANLKILLSRAGVVPFCPRRTDVKGSSHRSGHAGFPHAVESRLHGGRNAQATSQVKSRPRPTSGLTRRKN